MLKKKKSPQKDDNLSNVEKDLEKDGIRLFNNANVDEDFLQLPVDITAIDSKDLGKYLNAFTQQKLWIRTNLGRVGVLLGDLKLKLDVIRARVYTGLPLKMAVKEKELYLAGDKEAQEVLKQQNYYTEKCNMLEDYLSNLEDGIFNISREITRRNNDFNDQSLVDNVDGRKRWGRAGKKGVVK